MDQDLRKGHCMSPTKRKHLKSTFPSMMESYMSADELSKHLGRQMSIEAKRCQEPEGEIIETDAGDRRIKRKSTKLNKQQSHHGMILEGLDHEQVCHITRLNAEKNILEEEDEEEQHKMIKLKEQKHNDFIQGLIQLRRYYKNEYKKALREKVEHQKKRILEREKMKIEEEKRSEELQKRLLHRVPQKLPKSVVVKDVRVKTSFQTDYYKIISLENKLKKDGYLNKNHEIAAFWDFIIAPGNLESVTRDGQLSWEKIKTYHENNKTSLAANRERYDKNRLVRQVENRVSYQGRSSKWRSKIHGIRTIISPWSLSDVPSSGGKSLPPVSGNKSRARNTPQSLAMSIEKKFPKVEFPPLAAYRLEFGKAMPSLEEIRKIEVAEKKLQERNDLKRALYTMFSHALANRAATQRLMEKNQDYNFQKLSGVAIIDEFHELTTKPPSRTLKGQDSRHGNGTNAGSCSLPVSRKNREKRSEAQDTKCEPDGQDVSESSLSLSSCEDLAVERPPLTMNQVAESGVVMEAHCLSTLWVNPWS